MDNTFSNPFRPGAGHYPPYLAGREDEQREFERLLQQNEILENLILTGLRGVGKTVLMEKLKPLAQKERWLWTGTDLTESTTINEDNMAVRIITDLSVITSNWVISSGASHPIGFTGNGEGINHHLDYGFLMDSYARTPGLILDKLKHVLEFVWPVLEEKGFRGVIFAYDEAQNLADRAENDQYPLSILLDVFQSLQRKGIPFMLALSGLPTLHSKLVGARTYSERMFRVLTLGQLNEQEARDAITKPIDAASSCPITFDDASIELIISQSGGYPYFVQFICREVYDVWVADQKTGRTSIVPMEPITRKLDNDFFSAKWARTTDRQRDLLQLVASLQTSDGEFTVSEIVDASKADVNVKEIGSSQCGQLLSSLTGAGLVHKSRHGKYSFSIPLFGQFIKRQFD